ncbi:hypothetical protein EMIT0P12_20050 [Pseudomonas sp. IT-P12]|uniref:DUF4376 domain-containing protein n=1 Tax=Pseudomonas sp. IT-P12 TaxID=3026450 RepID=UPI0039E1D581
MEFYYLPDGSAVGTYNGMPYNFHSEATPVEWDWLQREIEQGRAVQTTAPETPVTPVDIPAAIAARRFDAEVAGITVAGVPVYTDRTTQNKLTAAAFRALRNPEYTVDWKCTNGSFITLNAEQITAIADAVGDYVQACYTREGELVAAFNDGTYTEAMLEEGWPA